MLRFAEGITLLANTEKELEEALNVTETVFNDYNMKINIGKTKVIACGIRQTKIAFTKIPQLLILNIDLEIRKKLLKTCVWLRNMDYR